MDIEKLIRKEKKELDREMKGYQKMFEEIKPFIKKRERKQYSTRGKWKFSSH